MDKYNTEIFGKFTYPESMTYEDLLSYEKMLLENIDNIMLDGGAEHLDFTPLGDILMFQCAFVTQNLEILRDIADEIASLLPKGVKCKLLCLEKNLSSYHLFWIKRGEWQEHEYLLPSMGPDESIVHKSAIMEEEFSHFHDSNVSNDEHGDNRIQS